MAVELVNSPLKLVLNNILMRSFEYFCKNFNIWIHVRQSVELKVNQKSQIETYFADEIG